MDSRRQINVEEVAKINNEAMNWTATCRFCGERLTGTISELKAHKDKCQAQR
jgi:hypothetical protein